MSDSVPSSSAEFIVKLSDLPANREVTLRPAFIEDSIGSLPIRAALEREPGDAAIGSGKATVELYEGSPGVFVRGTMTGSIEVACGRCIEPVTVPIDEEITVSYLPADQVPDEDAEEEEIDPADIEADDVDLYPYEGEQIDLSRLFRERLIFAIPFSPLCTEDCKGLCTVCGSDLNKGECGCDRFVADPRLAKLRDIKLSST